MFLRWLGNLFCIYDIIMYIEQCLEMLSIVTASYSGFICSRKIKREYIVYKSINVWLFIYTLLRVTTSLCKSRKMLKYAFRVPTVCRSKPRSKDVVIPKSVCVCIWTHFEKTETGYILQGRILRFVQHVLYIHLNITSMAIHVPVCISNIKISAVFTCLTLNILWWIKRSFRDKNCILKAIPFFKPFKLFL